MLKTTSTVVKYHICYNSCNFTIVELLIVVAIIGILASILFPALNKARETAKTIGCINNQKNLCTAHAMYQADWDGYMVPNFQSNGWTKLLGEYLGGYIKPITKTGTVWTCPKQPEGNFHGNFSSYIRNNFIGDNGGGLNNNPFKFTLFKQPSGKLFVADGTNQALQSPFWVYPYELGVTGKLSIRHQLKCNIAFLDGHVKSYGCPPVPSADPGHDGGFRWLHHNYPVPDGL